MDKEEEILERKQTNCNNTFILFLFFGEGPLFTEEPIFLTSTNMKKIYQNQTNCPSEQSNLPIKVDPSVKPNSTFVMCMITIITIIIFTAKEPNNSPSQRTIKQLARTPN